MVQNGNDQLACMSAVCCFVGVEGWGKEWGRDWNSGDKD